MNIKIMVLLLTITVAVMRSCSLGGVIVLPDDGKILDERFGQFVEAIKNQDETALRSMFSANALANNADFEEQVECLFESIDGEIESWERSGGPGAFESRGAEPGLGWKEIRATYNIITSEQVYHASLQEITKHTEIPDNVGVSSFCIINANDWNEDYNYWGDLGLPKDYITLGVFVDTGENGVTQELPIIIKAPRRRVHFRSMNHLMFMYIPLGHSVAWDSES